MKVLLLLVFLSSFSSATIINAASCSAAAVNTALSSAAASGDTVVIPSCGSTTWTTQVVVNKSVKIMGQSTCSGTPASSCSDNTNITLNANQVFQLFPSSSQFIEITGISFTIGGSCLNSPNSCIALWGSLTAGGFRFHHVHITNSSSVPAMMVQGWGLMDHILFSGSGTGRLLDNYGDAGNRGNTSWNTTQSWGDGNAAFLEDSTMTISNSIDGIMDGFAGGRIVVRNNSFTYTGTSAGDTIGFHGTDSGSYRSHMSVEVYNNTITNSGSNTMRAGLHRGGSGLWHDNTYVGSFGGILLQYFRSCFTSDISTWQVCNGTNYEIATTLDATVTSGGDHFCAAHPDQWCATSADCPGAGACTGFFDASVNSCRDEPGKTHDQLLDTGGLGARSWNNGSVTMGTDCSGHATFSNTQFAYTPFTYPHPLQGVSPQASSPTFSPGAGTYTSSRSVTISSTSGGAIICYNTTGSPATNGTTGCTTGTLYAGPVSVSVNSTLFAVAGGTGFSDSAVANASYNFVILPQNGSGTGLTAISH